MKSVIHPKKFIKASEVPKVTLFVDYMPDDSWGSSNRRREEISGVTLYDALLNVVDTLDLWLTRASIREDGLNSEDIINDINLTNGDGCDLILQLKNLSTGEIYVEYDYDPTEEDY